MSDFVTPTGTIYYEIVEPDVERPAPVVLVHNFLSTGQTVWRPMLATLDGPFRILYMDLPGHGRSHGYPLAFDHGEIAHQLAVMLLETGMKKAHLVGASAGGAIIQRLVHDAGYQPSSLTLISSTYSLDPVETGEAISMRFDAMDLKADWLPATAQLHDPHHYPGYFNNELLPALKQLSPQLVIDLQLQDVAQWDFPVCLIHGAQDEIFPVGLAESIAAKLPSAELHIFPNEGHALVFRQARQVAARLRDFLERQIE
jgi:3-oxoadipate enol-lactonase